MHATKYTWPSGSLVFDAGTNHWNWGLALNADGEGEPDRRIQQATTNVLVDMGALPETPAANIVLDDPSAPPLDDAAHARPRTRPAWIRPRTVRATFSRPMDAAR